MTDETAAKEMLQHIDAQIMRHVSEREDRIQQTWDRWKGKRYSLLNSELERIEIDKHHAQYVLETAHLRAERAHIVDALCQVEMAKPQSIFVPVP